MPLRHPVARFSLAVAAVILTTWANFYIQALASNQVKPLPFFPVLIVVTYYAGLLPAILFVVLAAVALDYWWMEPAGSLSITRSADAWVVLFFLLASGAIIAVSNAARRLVANLRLQESRLDTARAAAAAAEQRFRVALEGSSVIVWSCGADRRFNWIYDPHSRVDLLGTPIPGHLPGYGSPRYAEALDRAWRRGQSEDLPVQSLQEGNIQHHLAHIEPVKDSSARVIGLVGSFVDVTLLRAAEDAQARMHASLRESEESLRLALEGARLGMWVRDLTTNAIEGTPRYYEILGLPPDSAPLSLERWQQAVHPDDLPQLWEVARRAVENRTAYEHQFRVVRCDGSIVWTESRARVSYDQRDMPTRIVGILMDITDRKEAEAVLRESSRRKDEFLAILAHELRNPLAPIRYAGRMLKGPITQDRMVNVSSMIERQLAHMTRLLDDLLDTSRVSRGVLELRLEPLDLRAAIEAAIDATRPSLETAGQTLITRISPSPLPVDGDRVRLTQAVGNLLDNASKYSDPGTQIEIETRETAEEVIVEVRDHGIGISRELLPKVFELFTQGAHGTAKSKGLGIGLALTQQLVILHEGRIEAHSDGPGLGSRFVLRLPRRADVSVTPEPPLPPAVRDARGVRILIADDNIDGAEALALVLEQASHLTQVAHDGVSALTLAEIFRPQIALLDIGLPDMTGLELARQIRARSWGVSMRLIAVTGWGQESDRRQSTDAGFDEHFTKPVDPDQLLLSIAACAPESQSAIEPRAGSAATSMT
jgi:PAS domain S-box-containing protein